MAAGQKKKVPLNRSQSQSRRTGKKTAKKAVRKSVSRAVKPASRASSSNPARRANSKKNQEATASSGPMIRAIRPVTSRGPAPIRLLWIPGLGGDRMMFARIIEHLEHMLPVPVLHTFLEYPDVMPGEVDSLENLATLMAQGILPEDPYDMAIGYSMGGMMLQVLRMRGKLRARQCALLASAFSGNDLNTVIRKVAALPGPPRFLRGIGQAITAALYPVFRLGVRDASEYGRMFGRFPRTIFFEGHRWIREWKGVPEPFYKDCLTVHGTRDPLLSYRRIKATKPPDLTIEGGSHILFATHPDWIADFLALHLKVPVRVR